MKLFTLQCVLSLFIATAFMTDDLVQALVAFEPAWKNATFFRTRRKIARVTSEWIKSWLKAVTSSIETSVYRPNTLQYRQARYRRKYRPIPIPVPRVKLKARAPRRRRGYYQVPTFTVHVLWRRKPRHKVNIVRKCCRIWQVLQAHDETDKGPPTKPRQAVMDTDSFDIGVDNRASRCISHRIEDFDGPLRPCRRRVRGWMGSESTDIRIGTVRWTIEDDTGRRHTLRIPNSLYVPEGGVRLLSPQHWAQAARDFKPLPRGTRCVTYHDIIELEWGQRQYKKTCRLDALGGNVATIRSAPGFDRYEAYEAQLPQDQLYCFETVPAVVSDSEDEEQQTPPRQSQEREPSPAPQQEQPPQDGSDDTDSHDDELPNTPSTEEFNLDGPPGAELPEVIPDEEDQYSAGNLSAELLHYHHRFGHASMSKLRKMAKAGVMPRRLGKCSVPLCSSCLYGKATRRPWRTKGKRQHIARTVTRPGQCVSIDQMESPTPGLIAQLRGIPTKKRYKCATVFVDQYSGLSFVYLQTSTNAEETVKAKEAFELYAATHGIVVEHYHADNGVFADRRFSDAVRSKRQTMSFCGVNAHWMNGVCEKRIRDLTEMARTMLIHAQRRWPRAITVNLWPYAFRHACQVFNNTPILQREDAKTPLQLFARTDVEINVKHWVPFGCPTYVLDNALQNRRKINRWSQRARVGAYLGFSPQHARSVALILNLNHGLVSPQFHVQFDTKFATMRASFGDQQPPSNWQSKCGFAVPPEQASEGARDLNKVRRTA